LQIKNEVTGVLADSKIRENMLFLPDVQLDRKLYVDVNKVLVALGGTWNRKEKAHIFVYSPADAIEEALQTGEYTDAKKEFQFFETPQEIVDMLVEQACIEDDHTILESSAGRGAIANCVPILKPIKKTCDCIELNEKNREFLIAEGFNVVGRNFLEFSEPYDIIIANPPFTKQQDIDHVNHMIDLARVRVISVMSGSVLWRDNRKTSEFRLRVESLGGWFEELPEKAFAESGANIKTCIVVIPINRFNQEYEARETQGSKYLKTGNRDVFKQLALF